MKHHDLASMIFPPVNPLPEALCEPRTRQEVLQQIQSDPETLFQFNTLTAQNQEALLDFCMGNRGLKITYDSFFQNIFHPLKHPERLSALLSSILRQPITVKGILPREGVRLAAEASLMIMDIIVELSDGSLINVEMQKIGYNFPIERSFCYGADLLVRQYDRIRYQQQAAFQYDNMRPIYVIVLMEASSDLFRQYPHHYLHRSTVQLDSGVPIENLLNIIYISLDIFREMQHNELTELDAWLYFLSSDNPIHIQQIIERYPCFKELYRDIINFRYHPKELITMFSESLRIADQNTITLMIDELKEQVQELEQKRNALESENELLASKKDAIISEKDAVISEKDAVISEKDAVISEKDAVISEKDAVISEKDAVISEKDAEIARLRELVEGKE